jgi:hypothetical protein
VNLCENLSPVEKVRESFPPSLFCLANRDFGAGTNSLHRPRAKRRRLAREYIQGVGANHRRGVCSKSLDLLPWWLAFGLGDKELPQQRGARPVEQTAHQTE